jgi:hypothetical protein
MVTFTAKHVLFQKQMVPCYICYNYYSNYFEKIISIKDV